MAKLGSREAFGEHALGRWAEAHLCWQAERGFSERTVWITRVELRYFFRWCEARGILRPEEVTRPMLERYQRHLFLHRKKDGQALSWRSQSQRVRTVQQYFRWLVRQNVLLWNPASDLVLPRKEHRLPKAILTEEEVERVLAQPDVSTPVGLRDRAVLEVLYGAGLRRLELTRLTLVDVDWERETLWLRQAKGKKDRVVPLGARARMWVERYVRDARGELACGRDGGALFLTVQGEAMTADPLTHQTRQYVVAAGVNKPGSCHLFRHTMATLMLEGGADVRYVQEMLGHASLQTTAIYTHVSIRKLTEVHAATHPGAKLKKLSERHVEESSTVEGQGEVLEPPQ
jgi:integrase/recombinase XerD